MRDKIIDETIVRHASNCSLEVDLTSLSWLARAWRCFPRFGHFGHPGGLKTPMPYLTPFFGSHTFLLLYRVYLIISLPYSSWMSVLVNHLISPTFLMTVSPFAPSSSQVLSSAEYGLWTNVYVHTQQCFHWSSLDYHPSAAFMRIDMQLICR